MNQKIRTKCGRVDLMLNGGIATGQVTELYGESGVGKTQLCLQLLLTCLFIPPEGLYGSSIYIQACPIFSAERLYQLSLTLRQSEDFDGEDPLSLVQVKKISKADDLMLVLNQVEDMIISSHDSCRHIRFVVLDSIAYLFRHHHDNTSEGFIDRRKVLIAAAKKMKELATSYNVAFVVVNEVTDIFDTSDSRNAIRTFTSGREVKASLGMVWESLMPIRLFVSKQYNNDTDSWERDLKVVKCNDNSLVGRHCRFRLTTAGLGDY